MGRKQRIVPLSNDLTMALHPLLREHGISHHGPLPLFLDRHARRLTRFSAVRIVRRAAAAASIGMVEHARK